MGIEIEMTGSGELGPIEPGWNVSEYATPVAIGETSGGTGAVSFNAAARDNSLFVVNNNITTTEQDLGYISGVVKSVSQSGLNVSVSHDTLMSVFNATENIPALGAGGIVPALDVCNQIAQRDIMLNADSGHFYSLRGHSAGFDKNGLPVEPVISDGSYIYYNPSTGNFYPIYYREQYGSIWANQFEVVGDEIWSNYVIGDTFSNSVFIPTSRAAFKTIIDAVNDTSTTFTFGFSPDDSNTGSGQYVSITLDYATQKLYVSGEYRSGGILQNLDAFTDFPEGIDFDAEFAIFIEFTRPQTGSGYLLNVTACNTSDYTNFASINLPYNADNSYYANNWNIQGKARSVYRDQALSYDSVLVPFEYENPKTYVVSAPVEINGPVIAQSKVNMWEYLQQACAAYHNEISIVNDVIEVRAIGERELDITNVAGAPTVAPNITLSGRNVEIVYSNGYNIDNGELYNAYKDDNRVLSVKASETVSTKIDIDGTPAFLYIPQRSTVPPAGLNEYCVIDSSGLQIPQELWEKYGGKLSISLNPDIANAIDVTLVGPTSTDGTFNETVAGSTTTPAMYPGPYKIAYSSGETEYAALSIMGSGVLFKEKKLKLLTGADPEKTPQDIAKTVTNPFIATEQQAYDRGAWASIEASGPRVVLSGSIPVHAQMHFGLVAGSRIRYRDSIYRVTDTTIGNLGVDFNAVRHVTVDDFDALWAGKSVGLHDAMWEGYDSSDHIIAPLRYIGDDESVLMFLDTDVNPYYDFEGDPEISVFPDTDNNPYYVTGGNLDGEDEILLDEDENPYDGGDGYGS